MTKYEILEFVGKHRWLSTRQLQLLNYGVNKSNRLSFFNIKNLYINLKALEKENLLIRKWYILEHQSIYSLSYTGVNSVGQANWKPYTFNIGQHHHNNFIVELISMILRHESTPITPNVYQTDRDFDDVTIKGKYEISPDFVIGKTWYEVELSRKKLSFYIQRWSILERYKSQNLFERVVYFVNERMQNWFINHFDKKHIPEFISFYSLADIKKKNFIDDIIKNVNAIDFDIKVKEETELVKELPVNSQAPNLANSNFDNLKKATVTLYETSGERTLEQYFKFGLPQSEAQWLKLFNLLQNDFDFVGQDWLRK